MKTVLVTGASNGIGFEIAKILAEKGYRPFLVARNAELLTKRAGELKNLYPTCEAQVFALDLARKSAGRELIAEIKSRGILIFGLVNNAGFGLYGPFRESDLNRELEMIEVNVARLTELTKVFLPAMIEAREGFILNVASTAAFQPGPLMAVYYATKAYVLSFTEALGEELRGSGVRVSALCPGPTRTGFEKAAKLETSKLFKSNPVMEANAVARQGVEGVLKGQRIIVPGWNNRVLTQFVRVTPRTWVTKMVRRIQERSTES